MIKLSYNLLILWGICSGLTVVHATEKPNIIFLFTDDQRWDAMGCAGNEIIETPNLDKLALDGVLVTSALAGTLTRLGDREFRIDALQLPDAVRNRLATTAGDALEALDLRLSSTAAHTLTFDPLRLTYDPYETAGG